MNHFTEKSEIAVIGAAIVDVLARPVSEKLFRIGSTPVESTRISFGGDALNEAAALSKLGKQAALVSCVGDDAAGEMVRDYCLKNGIDISRVRVEPGLTTGVNIVLVDDRGERFFLTNPASSLRTLSEEDLLPFLDGLPELICFASIFVSARLGIPEMTSVFRKIREKKSRILCADITKAKHGERLKDLEALLPCIDVLFPNEEEIALLTGCTDPEENARLLLESGVGCAVIKLGRRGCYIRSREEAFYVPACPSARCVDTTGAGDTFAAGFLWALSERFSLSDCGRFACAAASCAIEGLGATDALHSLDQVMERFRGMPEALS